MGPEEVRDVNIFAWFTDPANWSGPDGIPVRTLQHIVISAGAMIIALAIAMPVGLILGHKGKGAFLANNLGNIGRAVPVLGVLIIFASITVIGVRPRSWPLPCSPSHPCSRTPSQVSRKWIRRGVTPRGDWV